MISCLVITENSIWGFSARLGEDLFIIIISFFNGLGFVLLSLFSFRVVFGYSLLCCHIFVYFLDVLLFCHLVGFFRCSDIYLGWVLL